MQKIVLLLFAGIFLIACSKEESSSCYTHSALTYNLETNYGCLQTVYELDVTDLEEDFIIIKDNKTFKERVVGSCVEELDFDNYDLLIGKKGLTRGLSFISYVMTTDCDLVNPKIKISFHLNETTEAPTVTYHVFIPKLPIDALLEVQLITI